MSSKQDIRKVGSLKPLKELDVIDNLLYEASSTDTDTYTYFDTSTLSHDISTIIQKDVDEESKDVVSRSNVNDNTKHNQKFNLLEGDYIQEIYKNYAALKLKKLSRINIIVERVKEYLKMSNPTSIDDCKLLLCKYGCIVKYSYANKLINKHPILFQAVLLIYIYLRNRLEDLQGHPIIVPKTFQ
jgi:hypothetical protein